MHLRCMRLKSEGCPSMPVVKISLYNRPLRVKRLKEMKQGGSRNAECGKEKIEYRRQETEYKIQKSGVSIQKSEGSC